MAKMAKKRPARNKALEEYTPELFKEESLTVVTYNGKVFPKAECRSINGKYYKIGSINKKDSGDCYLMEDDVYYRLAAGKIAWDYEKQVYNYVHLMTKGYVPDTEKIGYFTHNFLKNYLANDELYVFDDSTIKMHKLAYDFRYGHFNEKNNVSAIVPVQIRDKPNYRTLPNNIYGMSEYPTDILGQIARSFKDTYENTPENNLDKFLFNFRYGLEIETDMGWWPENQYYKHGCIPLKDGSIYGTEITTVPYPGKFNLFKNLFESVSKYTVATSNNSLHVNISGFENTPAFRVAMYVMYYRLQQEINGFIPIYKRELNYLINKNGGPKDHCKQMERLGIVFRYDNSSKEQYAKQIEQSDIEIFKFLNEGVYNDRFNIKTRLHQKDGQHKWDQHNRYYALNLMPLYFGKPTYSRVEYRVHSGTVNPTKSMIWLLITAAITKFVENNTERILCSREKISIGDILKEIFMDGTEEGEFTFNYILAYMSKRENDNIQIATRHGDIYGNEFSNDPSFAFKLNGRDLFDEPKNKRT